MYDLSILIPAKNEEWLGRTIQDILDHKRWKTEVIAVLDGYDRPVPDIPQHPDVKVIRNEVSKGQRSATNQACLASEAKYIMKVDAHCAFDEGFDVKLIRKMQDNWTMVPIMRNLHVFNWLCPNGHRRYQSPSGVCHECGEPTEKEVVWIAKTNPSSTSYCFDETPHFQYANWMKKRESYRRGVLIGYSLGFPPKILSDICTESFGGSKPATFSGVINLLADFASSHHLPSGVYSFGSGEKVTVDTVGLSSILDCGSIGTSKVISVRNEFKMQGITTSPVLTEMVNNGDIFSSASGERCDEPSVKNTMNEMFIQEIGEPITISVNSASPNPTSSRIVNSYVVNELNRILGGEFIYSEKTNSFHNGSVVLLPVYDKYLTETMSVQGSCFLMTREKYWELNICDESIGSWGSQGIEVACKTWLSGGRVVVNHDTWYAHLFRTQGGDFSFPYQQDGKQVQRAKTSVRELFFDNKWPQQTRPLSWLLERFWPVDGWSEHMRQKIKNWPLPQKNVSVGCLYYTDNEMSEPLASKVREQILKGMPKGAKLVSVSLKPLDFGQNIVLPLERGKLTMHKQILAGLEALDTDIVFFVEHDVLYHPSHFDFRPPKDDTFYYNMNLWRVRQSDFFMVKYDHKSLSQLCAYRSKLIPEYKERVRKIEAEGWDKNGFEPATRSIRLGGFSNDVAEHWLSTFPNIDIRHGKNLSSSKWHPSEFRSQRSCRNWQESTLDKIEGWENPCEMIK